MNLKEIKFGPFEQFSQVILFDREGKIKESDDTIVKVSETSFNVFQDSFLCGMEELVFDLKVNEPLTFDCINTDLFGKTSHFDLMVKPVDDDHYALIIYDFGTQYDRIFELQQERNVAEIQAKRAQRETNKAQQEKETLEKLYHELQEGLSSQFILVKADNLLVNVDLRDIHYLEAYGDYIKVHTKDKVYVTYNTMKNMEASMPKNQFFRIHRSFIIRLDKVVNIEQLSVLIGDKTLPIGKNYKTDLVEKMGQL